MLKKYVLFSFVLVFLFSCKKEELTKTRTWVNLTYRIHSTDSNLMVNLMRGIYTDAVKGNIGKDTILVSPGSYNIPATVLIGEKVTLFALSYKGPNFNLGIYDEDGNVLAKTDSIIHHPVNQLDTVEKWSSKIYIIPD